MYLDITLIDHRARMIPRFVSVRRLQILAYEAEEIQRVRRAAPKRACYGEEVTASYEPPARVIIR